jgi:hypothetical protein
MARDELKRKVMVREDHRIRLFTNFLGKIETFMFPRVANFISSLELCNKSPIDVNHKSVNVDA